MRRKFAQLIVGLGLVGGGFSALAQGTYLNITVTVSNQVVLSWPAAATNFVLQSTTNLTGTNWYAVSDAPFIVGSEFHVTNAMLPPQQFYRLSSYNYIPPGDTKKLAGRP
jgi:hypothetical protein